jgi:hypothetical protein
VISSAKLDLDATLAGRCSREIDVVEQVQAIVLFSAIRLSDSGIPGAHEERAGAIAWNPALANGHGVERFAAQALHRIPSHRFERTDALAHRRIFASAAFVPADTVDLLEFEPPGPKAQAMELRPLKLGEIFDRAIALYVRNFLVFAGIVAVMVVPVALVQYFVALREQPEIDEALRVWGHPERFPAGHFPTLLTPSSIALIATSVLVSYLLLAFAASAVGAGVARIYRDQPVAFGACYAAVLRRWPSVVALIVLALIGAIVAYAVLLTVSMVPLLMVAVAGKTLLPMVAPLALTCVIFAIVFALVLLVLTSACALYAIVIEGDGTAQALRLTFERVFNRGEFGRAVLCAFSVGAIAFVASAIVNLATLLGLSHSPVGSVSLDAIERIAVVPFVALVLAVYYFDLRVRNDTFDLETRSELLAGDADEPEYAPTAYLSGDERTLVKRFLARRDAMTPRRRREIAAQLAGPVRERVPGELARLDDEGLLERL